MAFAPLRVAALALSALLAGLPALADDPPGTPPGEPVDGPAFRALAEGRTLAYRREGEAQPYGIERHYPGGRVTWFLVGAGTCLEGDWFAAGTPGAPQVCFAYSDGSGPHCFRYWRDGDRLWSTNLDGSALDETALGDEHRLDFGCEFLGS